MKVLPGQDGDIGWVADGIETTRIQMSVAEYYEDNNTIEADMEAKGWWVAGCQDFFPGEKIYTGEQVGEDTLYLVFRRKFATVSYE